MVTIVTSTHKFGLQARRLQRSECIKNQVEISLFRPERLCWLHAVRPLLHLHLLGNHLGNQVIYACTQAHVHHRSLIQYGTGSTQG